MNHDTETWYVKVKYVHCCPACECECLEHAASFEPCAICFMCGAGFSHSDMQEDLYIQA